MSNARHTPETDAFANAPADEQTLPGIAREWASFARSLETQRDAALERERGLREALSALITAWDEDDQAAFCKTALPNARAALAAKGEK